MLAELAMASAAYSTIKTAIGQGRELVDYGKQITDFVTAEEDLKLRVEKEKKNPLNRIMGKDASDLESFLALDKIKQQKAELQSHMRLFGRPGLYDDYVAYCAQARKARMEALKQREKERQEMIEILTWVFIVVVVWGGLGYSAYYWFTK